MSNNSTVADDCPEFDKNYLKILDSPCFFIAYPIICCMALVGNCTVAWLVGGKVSAIRRVTYRCLTLLLCGCELLAALVLLLMLFRMGIGRQNRLQGTSVVDPSWTREQENPLMTRRPSLISVLISLRDVTIGAEIFSYCLLAIDRLLAVATPTSRVWNRRLAIAISCVVLVAMATAEVGLQTWRWLGLPQKDAAAACDHLRAHSQINALGKAGLAILLYVISAAAYAATGAILAFRRGGDQSDEQHRALRRSLIGLALGNLIQLLSLVPMTLKNLINLNLEDCLYSVFFINTAAVPCLTVAFNVSVRDRLIAACGPAQSEGR